MTEQRTWGGRFEGGMDELTRDYTAGMDRDFWAHDIIGSVAHARMLGHQGIIPSSEADAIVAGLALVLEDFHAGRVTWRPEHEDIHTHVEVLLREKIGDAAGRLHTARSRNDQVALLNRMVVREACDIARESLTELVAVLCDLGDRHAADPMPGYTHVQRAQPVTLGHHLLAYGEMLLDVARRLEGSIAAAGYLEPRYLGAACNGFAVMLDLEQIQPDGARKPGAAGFAPTTAEPRFTLAGYIRRLFYAPPGYYRQIVFVVSDIGIAATTPAPTPGELRAIAKDGSAALPPGYGSVPFSWKYT